MSMKYEIKKINSLIQLDNQHLTFQVKELDNIILSTEFDIPMFIQEYDMSINGLRYYQP